MRDFVRRLDFEIRRALERTTRGDCPDAIDVASDDMAAELVADFERAFEIEPRANTPRAGGGALERLRCRIDVERGAIARLPDRDSRETWAGARDGCADRDRRIHRVRRPMSHGCRGREIGRAHV